MRITLIDESNFHAFEHMIFENMNNREESTVRLGAIIDNNPVGVAVFRIEGKSAALLFVYVEEEYRRRGVATELVRTMFNKIAGLFREKKIDVNAIVANYMDDQMEAQGLLEKVGFLCVQAGNVYGLTFNDLVNNEKTRKYLEAKYKDEVVAVRDLTNVRRGELFKFLKEKNITIDVLESTGFDSELSSVVFGKNNNMKMFMGCSRKSDNIIIDLFYGEGDVSSSLLLNFKHMYKCLKASNELDVPVIFASVNQRIDKLAEFFLGEDLMVINGINFAVRCV